MKIAVIEKKEVIVPFQEPASKLNILNNPLAFHQRNAFYHYSSERIKINELSDLATLAREEIVVYQDNSYFNGLMLDVFIRESRKRGIPSQLAFDLDDKSISEHAFWLQKDIIASDNIYLAPMYYFPNGFTNEIIPLQIDTLARCLWYMSLPTRDHSIRQGLFARKIIDDALAFSPYRLFVPLRAYVSIESWVHLLLANVLWGLYTNAALIDNVWNLGTKIKVFAKARFENKSALSCSYLVKIGKNCQIDPTATILGPTTIGDNVIIGPNALISASIIGNDVVIGPQCQIWVSVVGNACSLPFGARIFMACLYEKVITTCNIQFSIIGRGSFIGGGVRFLDRNLTGGKIVDRNLGGKMVETLWHGELQPTGCFFLGSAVGNNVKLGSGHYIHPGRIIESDLFLPGSNILHHIIKPPNPDSTHLDF